jgi:TonB family protein
MRGAFCLVALSLATTIPMNSWAQSSESSGVSPSGAVLSKLAPVIYPPLARQARIQGDVSLTVTVRRDGTAESVVLVSGHPLLVPSAIESARQSQFDCATCSEGPTAYSLVYLFKLEETKCCAVEETPPDKVRTIHEDPGGVTVSGSHVTVTAKPACICDPSAGVLRVRSAKCLYLWKCGRR